MTAAKGPLPLLRAQLGMIEGHMQVPGNAAYSVSQVRRIIGPLDVQAYLAAYGHLVEEIDCLRTRFVDTGNSWTQYLDARPVVSRSDWSGHTDSYGSARRYLQSRALEAFDLRQEAPLLRLELATLGSADHLELAVVHHAIADGYGSILILKRHAEIYCALRDGLPPPTPTGATLRDVVVAERKPPPNLGFWQEYLYGTPRRIALTETVAPPAALPLRHQQTVDGLLEALICSVGEIRWPYAVMAAVAEYVADTLGADDVVLGCVFAGRSRPEELVTASMLTTVLPLRLEVSDRTRRTLLRQVMREVGVVAAHVEDRPEQLRQDLPIAWRKGRLHGPTVNVVPFGAQPGLDGCEVRSECISRGPVDDLLVSVIPESDGGLVVDVAGNPRCYTTPELDRHAAGIRAALCGWL